MDDFSSPIVGRFAPSPTGRLHVGNAYVAIAAWCAAHSAGNSSARFLLRMEDNDFARSPKDADQWIKEDLDWLGLTWDEDVIYQSQRSDIYQDALDTLKCFTRNIGRGPEKAVYPCFCSRSYIHSISAPQEPDGFYIYPGTCRLLSEPLMGRQHSWRIAMPTENNAKSVVDFRDEVYGEEEWNLATDVGDVVLQRADGVFGYHLAVVVDDYLQGVNQIVRGSDLIRSTAAHIWIDRTLELCGWKRKQNNVALSSPKSIAPLSSTQFAHLPLLRNADGARLAKRNTSIEIKTLRDMGVPSSFVVGYCGYLLGLYDTFRPCGIEELLPLFSWDKVKCSRWGLEDRKINVEDIIHPETIKK